MRKQRILFFIGNLRVGGKERRLIELLKYLVKKGNAELLVVMTIGDVGFPDFYKLNIPYQVIGKSFEKNDITIFSKFYKICKSFNPDIIHTWGRMQSFYTLPTVLLKKIPLVNSQITDALPRKPIWSSNQLIDKLNFHFSSVILSNSMAGIQAHKPPKSKSKLIYNGIDLNRFAHLPDVAETKKKYGIQTPYTVLMAATFSKNKDYDLFFKVAEKTTRLRDDITFIGVGGNAGGPIYQQLLEMSRNHPRILFPGLINDVEALVKASDIGVLFSPNGEGISNSILEYMALSKPVIATDLGGNRELVMHEKNGYLVPNKASVDEVTSMIISLIDNKEKYSTFALNSRKKIETLFDLENMGQSFEQVYNDVLKVN